MSAVSATERPGDPETEPPNITELVVGMVRPLVDRPDAIVLEAETTESGTALRLFVDADDLAKVIGKQGRTARSLRTILGAIGSKTGNRYNLDVLEAQ